MGFSSHRSRSRLSRAPAPADSVSPRALARRKRNNRRPMLAYALTIFLGAFLLFQIEPLIGKYILPWFGGAPAVWTTCLLFFQLLLLAGYAYAHGLARRSRTRGKRLAHAALLAISVALLAVLAKVWSSPILAGPAWKPSDPSHPIPRILAVLAVSVGLPYFLLSTTSPLL